MTDFPYSIETDAAAIDYQQVADVLYKAGLSRTRESAQIEQAFKNSDVTIFIKDKDKVIGVGRALSDFVSQGAIYNVAVDPDYQRQKVGHTIITSLLDKLQGINVILYTHPQTLSLYEQYGFRRSKTAFAHFSHSSPQGLKWMEDQGFFLPEGFRFESEKGRY